MTDKAEKNVNTEEQDSENQNSEELGYCYLNKSCTGGKASQAPMSFAECQEIGGGSWKGPRECRET